PVAPPAPNPAPAAVPTTAPAALAPVVAAPESSQPGKIARLRPITAESAQSVLEASTHTALAREPHLEELVTVKPFQAPQLAFTDFRIEPTSPVNEGMVSKGWVTLAWTPVPLQGVAYKAEVSRSADFAQVMTFKAKKNQVA